MAHVVGAMSSDSQPLRAIEFEILLSLATGVRHGYAIIQDIEGRRGSAGDSGGSVETGTLYRALQRLAGQQLVSDAEPPERAPDDDERRRYYAITASGRRAAAAEARRMAALVDGARAARLIPGAA